MRIIPGVVWNFSQNIRDNVMESLSGIKGDNSVKIFGPDLNELEKLADLISNGRDIAARDPDVILVLAADAPTALQWSDHWQSLPALRAVKNKRVISFIDARLSRMGPEVVSATEALCTTLATGSAPQPPSPALPS